MEFILIAVVASLGVAAPTNNHVLEAPAQRHFVSETSCEQAASVAAPSSGKKLVCVPAESGIATPSAY